MQEEKIMPVEELVHEDEFTGRVEILRKLENWVEDIGRVGASSRSIIAPRRMGKTVLLDRLVNTIFFKPEYKVAPFYIKFKREETTLKQFLKEYALTFFRQYIAYCIQDPVLYSNTIIEFNDLLDIKSEHKGIQYAQHYIKGFLKRFNKNGADDTRNLWDDFIKIPEKIASYSGTRVVTIIDEFQDMKFYVYNTDESELNKWKVKNQGKPSYAAIDLTATYDRQSESRKAPMLVSGSAVTLIFRTVMGGPLGGRFSFQYLKPLSIDEGATLLTKLINIYLRDVSITPENAIYASVQVTGHPYYLYCLVDSDYPDKNFSTQADIDRLIDYEIKEGKIYGFWQTHFEKNKEYINNDNDEEIGKKIIYYFVKYNNKPVDIAEIANKINVSKKLVEKKIEKLYLADLVYKTKGRFYAFNDICLMRYIKFVYEKDLSGIDELDTSELGRYNYLKGKFLELVVQQSMSRFDGQTIDGSYLGQKEKIKVPLFSVVDTRYAKAEKTDTFQIDVFGKKSSNNSVWLVECKYRKSKMGLKVLKKAEKAAKAYKEQQKQETGTTPQVQIWLVSTGGFTQELLDEIRDRNNVYYSDYEGINNIFRKFGGGFDLPIFNS